MPESGLALGFDYGKRRVGLAIGSTVTASAQPLTTLEHLQGSPDWARLDELIAEWGPALLIVGLPWDIHGKNQKMTRRARNFAQELWGRHRLPVHAVDERYTSQEARHRLRQARQSGSRGKQLLKGDIDAMAAQVILESWLRGEIPASAIS